MLPIFTDMQMADLSEYLIYSSGKEMSTDMDGWTKTLFSFPFFNDGFQTIWEQDLFAHNVVGHQID